MDSKSKELVDEILHYYNQNRGVGHSKAVVYGAKNVHDARVVVVSREHAQYLDVPEEKTVPLDAIDKGFLLGADFPLVFDNWALFRLMSDMQADFEHLENVKEQAVGVADEYKAMNDRLRREKAALHNKYQRLKELAFKLYETWKYAAEETSDTGYGIAGGFGAIAERARDLFTFLEEETD